MPKLAMDYSKTFIYKLCCKDPTITDVYVGHTTNIVKRRYQHKHSCNNSSQKNYNYYVYQFIRDNGGWDNWEMIVVIELNCKDKNEALREERKYLEELNATLNKHIPSRTNKEYRTDTKHIKKEYDATYRKNNKEKIADAKKEYYYTDQRQKYMKDYKELNKEHIKELNRQSYLKRKEAKLD